MRRRRGGGLWSVRNGPELSQSLQIGLQDAGLGLGPLRAQATGPVPLVVADREIWDAARRCDPRGEGCVQMRQFEILADQRIYGVDGRSPAVGGGRSPVRRRGYKWRRFKTSNPY